MRTLEFESYAELSERVEAFPAEQVDEHLAPDGVVPLWGQQVELLTWHHAFLDQVGKHLAVSRVKLATQNCFVTVQQSGNAFAGPGHVSGGKFTNGHKN